MIYLQNDWDEAFRCGEPAWVTAKQPGEAGVHGRLEAPAGGPAVGRPLSASDGFRARLVAAGTVEVCHDSVPAPYRFSRPAAELRNIHSKAVNCIDVTPNGLGLSCASDDTLRVWETSTGTVRRELSGHLGPVNTCRFFPSGVVALSGGLDMQLKIWSAETGRCAATLRGHTGAVQDTAIVERGRNVLSVGRDGRCKLWDVGEQRGLADLCTTDSAINCVRLGQLPDGMDGGTRTEPPNEREVGTEGRLAAVGAEDGSVHLLHVHSRQPVASWQLPAAVTALAWPAAGQLVAGCRDGTVCWLEPRAGRPLASGRRSAAAVLALLPAAGRLLAARADGSVHTETAAADEPTLALSGPDCEPVYGLAAAADAVFTAARDGCVRRYRLPTL